MFLRSILPITISVLAFSACNQDDNLQPAPSHSVPIFGISGDTTVEVMRARNAEVSLVLSDSGAGQVVSLNITGLPPGVTAEADPANGTPPFSATVRFKASVYAVAGSSSTAMVFARRADSTEKRHSISVTVLENPVCTEIVAGQYRGYGGSGGGYLSTITADSALPTTRIRIKGLFAPMFDGYADLNCSNSTVVFPLQNTGAGGTLVGSGTFTHDTLRAAMTHTYYASGPNGTTGPLTTRNYEQMFARQ